jgi:hypothetical protein
VEIVKKFDEKTFCDTYLGADFFHVSMILILILLLLLFTPKSATVTIQYATRYIALCNIREEFGVTKAPPPPSTTPAQ